MANNTMTPRMSLIASELPQDEQMVVIVVGAEKKKYHVHRGLLTFHSNYFDNALNKHEWTEAQDRIVTLEDIESKTFDLFVDWIYSQKLPDTSEKWRNALNIDADPKKDKYDNKDDVSFAVALQLLKCYAFGDRFATDEFRRVVSDRLVDPRSRPRFAKYLHRGWCEIITYAFQSIPSQSIILQFLVDKHCDFWHYDTKSQEERDAYINLPPSFMLRVMKCFADVSGGLDHLDWDRRCYREHSNDAELDDCQMEYHVFYNHFKGHGYLLDHADLKEAKELLEEGQLEHSTVYGYL